VADAGEPPQVAALLLNWRHAELTATCLHDLLAARAVPMHVLVMDNGSDDGSAARLAALVAELAPRAAPHRLEFVAFEHNLGFTGAMNRGITWAVGRGLPFVLVLNNDLRLPPDFLLPLLGVLTADARVAAVGPTVVHPDGTVWAEGGALAFRPNALRLCGHARPPRPRDHGPEAVAFLPGACVLFRTGELHAVGGFDDAYFMYWEDVDLCDRLRARGGRIVWLPWVRVEHAAGQSSGGGRSPLRKFLMACNAVRYLRTRGTTKAWAAWLLFDVLLWPLTFATGPRPALAKLRGTLAGLRGHRASAADVQRLLPR
jgi:GT2 family glycosyltransferase